MPTGHSPYNDFEAENPRRIAIIAASFVPQSKSLIHKEHVMRSFVCGMLFASLAVGCTNSADYEVVHLKDSESEQATSAATDTLDAAETSDEKSEDAAPPAAEAKGVNVGDAAPTFAELIGVDDKKHSMDEFKSAKALAVVFTCNKCPVAVMYEDRLINYQKDYADKGVQVVAINVNNAEADKLPAMKVRAEEKGFNFPYLYDPSQKSARQYGAEVTPHVFLLNAERKVAYVGPVDDNTDEAQVKQALLREATDAVLEGKPVATTYEKPVGCGIQYEPL